MYTALGRLIQRRSLTGVPRRISSAAPPSRPPRLRSIAAGVALAASTYTIGTLYPPTVVELMFPLQAPPSPPELSDEGKAVTALIEDQLQGLPLVRALREKSSDYYEARPYQSYPEEKRIHSLTAGTLRGPGKLAVRPLIFAKWDESESIVILHLGRSLCGHDGIVHGGLLATLLDETLARNAFFNLPANIGVTAKLSVSYKAPTRADQFVVIRTKLLSVEGRKATISGQIEDLAGRTLVEANGLFIQPKYANMLKTEAMAVAMGKRPEPGHPIVGVDVAVSS